MDVQEWIACYGKAWRGESTVAALFTEDAVYRSAPTKPPHIGEHAIAAHWRSAARNCVDLRFGTPVVAGPRVAVEWWATTRDPATLPGCLVLRFAPDGRCAELREYYSPVLGQAVPAPLGWGR